MIASGIVGLACACYRRGFLDSCIMKLLSLNIFHQHPHKEDLVMQLETDRGPSPCVIRNISHVYDNTGNLCFTLGSISISLKLILWLSSISRSLKDSKTCQESLRTPQAFLRSVDVGVESVTVFVH